MILWALAYPSSSASSASQRWCSRRSRSASRLESSRRPWPGMRLVEPEFHWAEHPGTDLIAFRVQRYDRQKLIFRSENLVADRPDTSERQSDLRQRSIG